MGSALSKTPREKPSIFGSLGSLRGLKRLGRGALARLALEPVPTRPTQREGALAAARSGGWQEPEYRYERKFTTRSDPREVATVIRNHPGHFREVFAPRQINNIYLDSIDRRAFHDNVIGLDRRQKARIRWYGERFGTPDKMTLEFKKRVSLVGSKESHPLEPFCFAPGFSLPDLRAGLAASPLPADVACRLADQELALLNSYQRRYFVSRDGRYRVTIDWNLEFWRLSQHENQILGRYTEPGAIVIELKYDANRDDDAHSLSKLFPFRLSRNSKYVAGILATSTGVFS